MGRSWRFEHDHPRPLVLFEAVMGAQRLAAVCEAAEAAGLAPGTGLAEARARFPDLDVVAADPAADDRLLEALADWCDRYTPLVAFDRPQGLVLDISGCAHLFGGEKALMDDLLVRLFHQGFAAFAAIAAHPGTAMALAGEGADAAIAHDGIVAAGAEERTVAPLSIAALRLDAPRAAMLRRLGLKTVGSLFTLPRAGLARRFGEDMLRRLDEAAGRVFRPISPRRSVPDLCAERRLFEPISLVEDIERIVLLLAARLEKDLRTRGLGARRLELSLFRVDGKVERIAAAASRPLREPERIGRLFRERMKAIGDERDAGFGYDLVKLAVFASEPMAEIQTDLSGETGTSDAFSGLVDRIGARLGEASVLTLRPATSHRPERAETLVPLVGRKDEEAGTGFHRKASSRRQAADPLLAVPPRPVRLLALPEPIEASFEIPDGAPMSFRWRRALYRVRRAEGPERIGAEWWRDRKETARDYYSVEDEAGRRFWLFREGLRILEPAQPLAEFLEGEASSFTQEKACDPGVPLAIDQSSPDDEERRIAEGRSAWYLHGIFA